MSGATVTALYLGGRGSMTAPSPSPVPRAPLSPSTAPAQPPRFHTALCIWKIAF